MRALILGDTHCGSIAGLAHPEHWMEQIKPQQKAMWDWYVKVLEDYGPFDTLLGLGDFVDGEGKHDTLGIYETDTLLQAEHAEKVLRATNIPGKKMFLCRGTSYHVTGTYNYEDPMAEALGAHIRDEWHLDLNGLLVGTRHVVGRSNTPYGQGTPVYKEVVRDLMDAVAKDAEPATLILRGHAHISVEIKVSGRQGVSAPCMQFPGSVYGRRCMGFGYDVGIGVLEVEDKDTWLYKSVLMPYKVVGGREYVKV